MNDHCIGARPPVRTLAVLNLLWLLLAPVVSGAAANSTNPPAWWQRPLSLADALNLALQQNRTILQSRQNVEAATGVSLQTRAVTIPKIQSSGSYTDTDRRALEAFYPGQVIDRQNWSANIQIVQSLFEGGRLLSAVRAAKLIKEQALLEHQTLVADTLLATRIAYYDVLLAHQQIVVREASVNLLTQELQDEQHRYDAGTVPRFNVLRAEVAVANARPLLIRARNTHRIAQSNLAQLLGDHFPREMWETIPLHLSDSLATAPVDIQLPAAIVQALERRTELEALRKSAQLRQEDIITARSGRLPSLQGFAGWGWRDSSLTTDLSDTADGWQVGVRMNWYIFDGLATRGKVAQAKAAHERSRVEIDDASSRIELEVRTTYTVFISAREVLESQKKVQEQAEEALRLAQSRAAAGTATQLDVLTAETALTEARTTQIQAEYDYAVAIARLERAIGAFGTPQTD
ncbi:MAG TPA: TolC family protein [Verrucomicrobiota bacterium]|nr:TolC family protein [Verrucomicrobiota bacterium]HNT13343.1 TolC family protein [Verrucomicrobiota bacterium]